MNGYFKGGPVNALEDYDPTGNYDPFDQNIKPPVQWQPRLPDVPRKRVRRLVGQSELEGFGGIISDTAPAVKQFLLTYWPFLLATGIGAFYLWSRKR